MRRNPNLMIVLNPKGKRRRNALTIDIPNNISMRNAEKIATKLGIVVFRNASNEITFMWDDRPHGQKRLSMNMARPDAGMNVVRMIRERQKMLRDGIVKTTKCAVPGCSQQHTAVMDDVPAPTPENWDAQNKAVETLAEDVTFEVVSVPVCRAHANDKALWRKVCDMLVGVQNIRDAGADSRGFLPIYFDYLNRSKMTYGRVVSAVKRMHTRGWKHPKHRQNPGWDEIEGYSFDGDFYCVDCMQRISDNPDRGLICKCQPRDRDKNGLCQRNCHGYGPNPVFATDEWEPGDCCGSCGHVFRDPEYDDDDNADEGSLFPI